VMHHVLTGSLARRESPSLVQLGGTRLVLAGDEDSTQHRPAYRPVNVASLRSTNDSIPSLASSVRVTNS
jgi:hypothetical protein